MNVKGLKFSYPNLFGTIQSSLFLRKKIVAIYISLLCLVSFLACADIRPFEYYEIILRRKPFGDPPPQPVQKPTTIPKDSFAKGIKLTSIWQAIDGSIQVGFNDTRQKNKSYFLRVGESEDGISVISANIEEEEVILGKGEEMAVIKLSSDKAESISMGEYNARKPKRPTRRLTSRTRIKSRTREEPQPTEPKLTGAELKKHLQEYQMEIIRQGLPPLPIPLTEEMDAQLVKEGVLPPLTEE